MPESAASEVTSRIGAFAAAATYVRAPKSASDLSTETSSLRFTNTNADAARNVQWIGEHKSCPCQIDSHPQNILFLRRSKRRAYRYCQTLKSVQPRFVDNQIRYELIKPFVQPRNQSALEMLTSPSALKVISPSWEGCIFAPSLPTEIVATVISLCPGME
jgi:hypothetical protein